MSRSVRVTAALIVTLLAVSAMATYAALRVRHWDRKGIAGLIYLPPAQPSAKRKKAPPTLFGIKPGSVMLTSPIGSAGRAGIATGDEILSVNGVSIADTIELRRLNLRLRTGDTVTYRIRRGAETREVAVRLQSPARNSWYIASIAIAAVVALAFIAIGLLVLTRNPDDPRSAVFHAAVTVGALSIVAQAVLSVDGGNVRGIIAEQMSFAPVVTSLTIFYALMPLILHLALIFPRDRPILSGSRRVLRFVYGIPALGLVTSAGAMFFVSVVQETGEKAVARAQDPFVWATAIVAVTGMLAAFWLARLARGIGWARAFAGRPFVSLLVFYGAMFGLSWIFEALGWKAAAAIVGVLALVAPCLVVVSFPVIACVALYRSYREAGAEERRQVKWPLWAIIIAVVVKLAIFFGTQIVTFFVISTHRNLDEWIRGLMALNFIPTIVYLIIPISFAFAILKYRLMNIDVIIRKTVAYALLSGAIIVLYLALVGGLGTILVNIAGVKNQTTVIASTLVVALLVVPLRNKLQTLVDRNLFRHRYDYPDALKAIATETVSAHNLGTFLTGVAEKTQQALQNRAVVIFSSRHEEFVAAAKVGVADSVLGSLRVARETMLPLLERPFDPRKHAMPDDIATALKRIEAVLVVPVNTPGTPANGFIAVAPKLSSGGFEIEDIDFLRSVADQLDIGMDRIRMQADEVDVEQARAIQQTLLPREMPQVEGLEVTGVWRPARTVGGDYFDVLALGDRELAVCIGDVAGKGMSAALLMSGLQAAVRASASGSPRDLCERVRRVVVSSLTGGRFVTFFYATLDTEKRLLRWCNAGHNAPILVRADGTVVRLSEGGPAFTRLFRSEKYEEREMELMAGDRLVLFTDGVSEASAGGDEIVGEARLEQLVATHRDRDARAIQEAIVETATAHARGQLDDDLTLVVVAVTF